MSGAFNLTKLKTTELAGLKLIFHFYSQTGREKKTPKNKNQKLSWFMNQVGFLIINEQVTELELAR